jgi:salicylate hydroxylase
VNDPQVNYWLGPDAHAGRSTFHYEVLERTDNVVNYVLRGGDLFNMVLIVPDDIPDESLVSTIEGDVEEMCALFEGWDPR